MEPTDLRGPLRVVRETPPEERRRQRFWVWVMIIGVLLTAAAFAYKIAEFMFAMTSNDARGFAVVQITVYFCVAGGWLFLLAWCFITGRFRNIEAGKYQIFEVLEMEEDDDAA